MLYKIIYKEYYYIMVKFDKETIISFAKETNKAPFENAYAKTDYIINLIMKDIKDVNPYINNYELYVANEALTKAEIPASTLDLFLVLDAKQLELNFNEDKFFKFKMSLVNFGKNFIENFKLFNKKKKNKKKNKKRTEENQEEQFEKYSITEKKLTSYNVYDFHVDFLNELAKYFTEKTMIYLSDNCINIAGKDDLGLFIRIYVTFLNEENKAFMLYNLKTKNKTLVNFRERYDNFDIACIRTNDMFLTQLTIFNNMYYNIFKFVPNQILIESLLYSCPFNLFGEDVYETTMSLINYLKNTNIKNLKSICDDYELTKENLTPKNSVEILYKFINGLALL